MNGTGSHCFGIIGEGKKGAYNHVIVTRIRNDLSLGELISGESRFVGFYIYHFVVMSLILFKSRVGNRFAIRSTDVSVRIEYGHIFI